MSDTYTCAACGGVFEKGWTEEEAADELAQNFPGCEIQACVLICEDCYNQQEGSVLDAAKAHWASGKGRAQ